MKNIAFILTIFICIAALSSNAQENFPNEKNEKKVWISEVYLYNPETDTIRYKPNERKREWIEVYNGLQQGIKIRNLYFTDDPEHLLKWNSKRGNKGDKRVRRNGFVVIPLNRSGSSKSARLLGDILKDTLYLVVKTPKGAYISDTVYLHGNKTYPYARYPKGGPFTHPDALSPGVENVYFHESQPREQKGLSVQLGGATSHSQSLENTTRLAPAWALGIYRVKNYKFYTYERGIRLGVRGYGISYNDTQHSSKAMREISTKGRQTNYYFDFSFYLSHRFNKHFGFYYGGIYSLRFKSVLKYDQTLTTTYFSTGQTTSVTTSYKFKNHNSAIDFLDAAWVTGLRYYYKDAFSMSAYMTVDVLGLNGAEKQQRNIGFYITGEIPLWSSRGRVIKSRYLLR